jgi:hypothetical protein
MISRRALGATSRLVGLHLLLGSSLGIGAAAQPPPVLSRVALVVDTSADMLLTPQWVEHLESCDGWNPCSFSGDPSPSQELCNACVRDTIRYEASCATTWDASCRSGYAGCLNAVSGQTTCSPTMASTAGIPTRGDGSLELPGCDLDGDGLPHESRMWAVKRAVRDVSVTRKRVELSLARLSQVEGGQTCTTSAQCPDTPQLAVSVLTCEDHDDNIGTARLCLLDADVLDGPTVAGFEGQCARRPFTGSPSTFSCAACDSQVTYDRTWCELHGLDEIRTGGSSPLDGTTVTCFPEADPTHRFQRSHGGLLAGASCDPGGSQVLSNFSFSGTGDNRIQLLEWVDHVQFPLSTQVELRAAGQRPLAAALRDLQSWVVATATADAHSHCRPYRAVLLASGADSCEGPGTAAVAAASLQDLSFVNAGGVSVSGLDVPLHVVAFAPCPSTAPGCPARLELDAIAAAGGTSEAILVETPDELTETLRSLVREAAMIEVCNGQDDDCDGLIDEGLGC